MRLIKTIILFTLLGYSVLFCVFNFNRISVSIPFVAEVESVPLFLVILACLILGILLGSMIGTAKGVKYLFQNASTKKENKNLKKKLGLFETEQKIQEEVELQNRIKDK